MGICLDTEQNNDEMETVSGEPTRGASAWAARTTPPTAGFPMQNSSHVKFEPPSVPVIFILDMQDFGTLSSKTVTEVLMLEMKMAPTAKSYLVSGYPRSMRDVAEYSDKIQTVSGVVLVSWRQRVLERQIEYGARLGHVVLSLARMELRNFYRSVMPVADYFDQSNLLIAVNGERNPEDVYKDFRTAVLQILGSEDQNTINGVNGVGVGADGIPGEIVGVERVPSPPTPRSDVMTMAPPLVAPVVIPAQEPPKDIIATRYSIPKPDLIRVRGTPTTPTILWVVGGPGSNKAALCQRVVLHNEGWTHYSLGQRLRALADAGGAPASDGAIARMTLSAGELAPKDMVIRLVRGAVNEAARNGSGLVLDGYPRDVEQMEQLEREFNVEPRMVLLDCSKLQLGRGRRDDSVAAFRRRLEVFRELSLPMLKILDTNHRLVIVDGDTDTEEVQREFSRVLFEEMEKAEALAQLPPPPARKPPAPNSDIPSSMQQFAHAVSRMGGKLANGAVGNGAVANGHLPNGIANGFVGMANNKINPMRNKITTVSQISQDEVRRMYEQSVGEVTMNTHM